MKKVFRPFWSYDLKKTEEWLHSMALQGYHLIEIKTKTRHFVFEGSIPQELNYHIEYDKTQSDTLPTALKNDGWMQVFKHRKWYVIRNEKSADELKCFPVRDGIIRRNRFFMYLYGGISLYIILTSLFFLFLIGLTVFYFGNSVTFETSPFWIVTLIIGVALWALAPYSTIKLYKTNKKFL